MQVRYKTNYLIIGSGAAGGTIFKELIDRGIDCLVVEEGEWLETKDFKTNFLDSLSSLWVDAGYQFSSGTSIIPMLQGKGIGGSTLINGAIMQKIEKNYISKLKEIFRNDEVFNYDKLLLLQEEIVRLFNIKKNISHVIPNSKIENICKSLSWKADSQLRSAPNCKFSENCLNGCPNNAKLTIQNTIFNKKKHKNVLEKTKVKQLIIKNSKTEFALCESNNQEFLIKAKKIILCAGSIGSPKLLLKSKLKNKNIGKNFRCHLSSSVTGEMQNNKNEVDRLPMGYQIITNNKKVGTFFSQSVPKEITVSRLPFYGKELLKSYAKLNNYSNWVSSVPSSSQGVVSLDIFGNSKIKFSISKEDIEKIIISSIEIAKFLFLLGAKRVFMPFKNGNICTSIDQLEEIKNKNLSPKDLVIASSHLFGSCSPSTNPRESVIGKDFRVKDIENLYVIDSSSLPLPTSYNPQLTIMVIAKAAINSILNYE